MSSAFELTRVSVVRPGKILLDNISWSVEVGERWVVLGPNGAGKSTLMQVVGATMFPSTGTADVLGFRLGEVDVFDLRTRIGHTGTSIADRIPPHETVRDAVMSAAYAVLGRWQEKYDDLDAVRAEQIMGELGITALADRTFGTLSEGERKRTLIARALMTDPEVILFDEPAAGLDLGGREDLVGRLAALAADPDAPASVLVTHHVEEIPVGYSHALLLREGGVVAAGLMDDVLTDENLSKTFNLPLQVQKRRGRYTAWLR